MNEEDFYALTIASTDLITLIDEWDNKHIGSIVYRKDFLGGDKLLRLYLSSFPEDRHTNNFLLIHVKSITIIQKSFWKFGMTEEGLFKIKSEYYSGKAEDFCNCGRGKTFYVACDCGKIAVAEYLK